MKRRKKARRVQSAIAKFALVAAVAPIVMTSVHRFNGSTVQLAWRIPGCDLSSEFDVLRRQSRQVDRHRIR